MMTIIYGCISPMVLSENPWRTREYYKSVQRLDTHRFGLTIGKLIALLVGAAATAVIAIVTILSLRP